MAMMKRDRAYDRGEGGFTLIEVMMVVAIIGILAAMAIPQYARFACKTRQSEARLALEDLGRAQEIYYTEESRYSETLEALSYTQDPLSMYTLSIIEASSSAFILEAVGIINGHPDAWRVNERGVWTHTQAGCRY